MGDDPNRMPLRITTWNCAMGLHRKVDALRALDADLIVVPECASPSSKAMAEVYAAARSHCWVGDSQVKGLGVFSFGDVVLEAIESTTSDARFIVPIRVSGPWAFHLLAVWTQGGKGKRSYVEHTHTAVDKYEDWIRSAPTVLAGDFNSNAFWDHTRVRNHSALVRRLADLGIFSAYHAHYGEAHGSEKRATFYFYRHSDKPFHLDYVFLPEAWRRYLKGVEVGEPDRWLAHSDHCPVTVEVALPKGRRVIASPSPPPKSQR